MPRKQKKYHYIYKTTCTVTGKFYVGMHSTDNLEDGYLGSGKILGYSRKKYGDENHVREILEMVPSREALKAREKEIVNEQLLADPLNINLKYGGYGGGKIWSDEHREKFVRSSHHKLDRSANGSRGGRKSGAANLKKMRSNPSWEHNWKGRQHTPFTKQKMSASQKGKQIAENNSQFGTCWVIRDIPIKIKKEQLDEYIANGYRRGRK